MEIAEGIDLLDVGHEVQTVGVILQGKGRTALVMYPDEQLGMQLTQVYLTVEQWRALLEQSDFQNREVEVVEQDGSIGKAFLRKSQRTIDASVQWGVWKRDGYACRYCGKDDVPLTIDHLITWEERGPTIAENLVTACRKCNRVRGTMPYEQWLQSDHYRSVSASLTESERDANASLVAGLSSIPRVRRIRSR